MKKIFLGVVALAAAAALAHELVDFSHADHRWRAHNHVANARSGGRSSHGACPW